LREHGPDRGDLKVGLEPRKEARRAGGLPLDRNDGDLVALDCLASVDGYGLAQQGQGIDGPDPKAKRLAVADGSSCEWREPLAVVGGDVRAKEFSRDMDERIAAEQHLFPPRMDSYAIVPKGLIWG